MGEGPGVRAQTTPTTPAPPSHPGRPPRQGHRRPTMSIRSLLSTLNLFALLLATLWPDTEPNATAAGDIGSGLDPDGRP